MREFVDRRGSRTDRRDPTRPAIPPGPERRSGDRRRLPRARWRQWSTVLASAGLGVAAAFALQALRAGASPPAAPAPVAVPAPPAPPAPAAGPRITLPEAQALRDAAEALTPAGVALDEQAHATWVPRLGELEAAASDPRLPPEIRDDLHATMTALARVGVATKAP